ncbi:MAG: hypothetical protein LBU38_00035 [Propionibacteriaceae bacterium]|nr:hypothetical protein [Propionibacteriaceae bacterium]
MSRKENEFDLVKTKKSGFRKFLKFASIVSIIGGAIYTVLKKYSSDAETGWVSHTYADSYVAHPIADVTEDIVEAADK